MKKQVVKLNVNGVVQEILVETNELLLHTLRERLGLMGAKYACGNGQCGACTVIVNKDPILACLTLTVAADGKSIETIEGVATPDGRLDKMQESFLDEGAVQCGFCTPGMILMGRNLLEKNPDCDEEAVRAHIKGNTCRCTGYKSIVRAILNARDNLASRGAD